MSDPVGLIGPSSVGPGPKPRPTQPNDPDAPGFKDYLMENIKEVNKLQQDAEAGIEDLMTGKRDDIEAVMTNVEKADNAFRMLLQVRNKVMAAYDELKQVRV
jgi:flagellar hook-basal body complex protein FliE